MHSGQKRPRLMPIYNYQLHCGMQIQGLIITPISTKISSIVYLTHNAALLAQSDWIMATYASGWSIIITGCLLDALLKMICHSQNNFFEVIVKT